MKARDLCWDLMQATTENEVVKILAEAGYWDDEAAWRYYGGFENNFSGIGNQQADAVAALAEKIINGIDARLILACLMAGIEPTGPDAPQSIREAVARLFRSGLPPTSERAGRIAHWEPAATL